MKNKKSQSLAAEKAKYSNTFNIQIKEKSDKLINYFLLSYFAAGLLLAYFYDTWDVALGIGSLSLLAYYSAKRALPKSNLYQYVLSTVLGIFMAQFIYQMHGMFEMHFVAFIGSALLITYQNWKLQIPLVLVVVVHHALFGYLQFVGYDKIYFTQLEYMDLQTFIIHVILAAVIFFICGLWAHHFKKYSSRHIEQTYEMGRLQEETLQKEALLELSQNLKISNQNLKQAQKRAHLGSWERDVKTNKVLWSDEVYRIFDIDFNNQDLSYKTFLEFIHPEDKDYVNSLPQDHAVSYDCRIITKKGITKSVFIDRTPILNRNNEVIKTFGIIHDITERKAHESELENSNMELRKSNLELDKFVYSVSHDLRAPLLSMQGIIQITEEESAEELTKEHMQMLTGSITRLDNFIGEILEYSRNARLEVKKDPIDFKALLKGITSDLKYMSNETKPVEIKVNVMENGVFCSDKSRLSVVLNNLISNAIRYHNPAIENPFVAVDVKSTADFTDIEVHDNGIGIDEVNQQKIFDMFYRVSENSNGSGLGLYIVKETINKLQGNISVESTPGIGSKFTLSIPNLMFQ